MNELIEKVKMWGIAKGITGPDGKGMLLAQLSKSQEELTETRDAAVKMAQHESGSLVMIDAYLQLEDGIGDTVVTLILAAEMAGLDFQGCLQAAYDEISGRTGKMIGGQFIKDKP
jgi:hypothetical protein